MDAGYEAGDWFYIPLADGSFAPGRAVVKAPMFRALGYLFAPQDRPPTLDDVASSDPGDALAALAMSGMRIGKEWPVLGGAEPVDLREWRLPEGETALTFSPPERGVRVDVRNSQLQTVHSVLVPISELGRRQPGETFGAVAVENWYQHVLGERKLPPLWTQRWWDHPTPVPAAAVLPPPLSDEVDDLVRVVVPGGGWSAGDALERVLRRKLRRSVGEVDGNMRGPEAQEIFVYGPDGHRLAVEVERIVRAKRIPVGTHLLVEAGDESWTVQLTP